MLEKAIATTRRGQYTNVQYARFADDLVILIDSHPRHDWLVKAVERRLREELAKLRVEINEEKAGWRIWRRERSSFWALSSSHSEPAKVATVYRAEAQEADSVVCKA